MKDHLALLMAVLPGRDHLAGELAVLQTHHDVFVLVRVFDHTRTEAENVLALRDANAAVPKPLVSLMPCGPAEAMLLIAATTKFVSRAVCYAEAVASGANYIICQDRLASDRQGHQVPGSVLSVETLDTWATHLGVRLDADGRFDRTPRFLWYRRGVET
ncbi:MAG: hypothetical protein LC104_00815 [Bacteroidales bacterium]|nr:hypothetical protein [Bacteroidales bacterium]